MSETVICSVISLLLAAPGAGFFYYKRSLRYLQYFQQEEYTSKRFISWYWRNQAFDRRGSVCVLAALLLVAVTFALRLPASWISPFISLMAAVALFFVARSEEDPFTTGKIKLKMTARAKRIFNLAAAIYVVLNILLMGGLTVFAAVYATPVFWLCQLLFIQSHPIWLVLASSILQPHENALQEGFANEARALIRKYDPTVIGITGSYGKTSTKVVLRDILSSVAQTFSTPGSINSYMGVTREIRERLKPEHKFAVIEMGAYYRGSISKMCSLTPPKAGIITSIGVMHLERFGSQEAVFLAKSELAQAVPADGVLVCNGDNDYCRRAAAENPKRVTLLYGMEPEKGHLDAVMFDVSSIEKGSQFKIKWQGQEYEGFAAVLGRPLLSNILGAFTMVCALGVPPPVALAAIRNVKTESNRLEPVRVPIASFATEKNGHQPPAGQVLRLNDAYNSNPVGFAAALDVLKTMPGGKKILITPGMIELGEKQAEENTRAAAKAATICDLVLIVGDTNKDALAAGLKEGGLVTPDRVKEFSSMRSALNHLADCCTDGDVVLIENDLADLYENVPKF